MKPVCERGAESGQASSSSPQRLDVSERSISVLSKVFCRQSELFSRLKRNESSKK